MPWQGWKPVRKTVKQIEKTVKKTGGREVLSRLEGHGRAGSKSEKQ
jgi:hypothetical protein